MLLRFCSPQCAYCVFLRLSCVTLFIHFYRCMARKFYKNAQHINTNTRTHVKPFESLFRNPLSELVNESDDIGIEDERPTNLNDFVHFRILFLTMKAAN
jgi:hypothetical protein